MPLADLTAVANLALDHLGEPYLTDYLTDTGTTADAVRLHLPHCIETILEGHLWSFATRCSQLNVSGTTITTATLTTGTGNGSILWTSAVSGPAGNEISIAILQANLIQQLSVSATGSFVQVSFGLTGIQIEGTDIFPNIAGEFVEVGTGDPSGKPLFGTDVESSSLHCSYNTSEARWIIAIGHTEEDLPSDRYQAAASATYPWLVESWIAYGDYDLYSGQPIVTKIKGQPTAAEVVTAAVEVAELVTASLPDETTGSDLVAIATSANLSGGSSTANVYAPAWGSAFILPSDCLRMIKIDGADPDTPRNRFEIQGRYLLLEEALAEAPIIHYITNDPPVDEWPTTFTDAVAFLLASRLAPKLAQSPNLTAELFQKHEIALGKARSKDARETRSAENNTPRMLAARSGLVQARYQRTNLPPY